MKVPFVDLKAQYETIKSDIDRVISDVLSGATFVGGHHLHDFEKQFAASYGVKHCIGLGNGTDAIFITLKVLGIGPGDEVITAANSYIAASAAISLTGAKAVFADIDPKYYTIDVEDVDRKINAKTKAILPVHLYGQAAPIDQLQELARKHNLFVVEDCAQAHFTEENGVKVGTSSHAATFSFYPTKNLGAYGDAGCVITNDDELAENIRRYANQGALKKHQHDIEGVNSRLDTLQAAILSAKLKYIHYWTETRINHAAHYDKLLQACEKVEIPKVRENTKHTYHLYVIRCKGGVDRDQLKSYLADNDVITEVHYPLALPNMEAYDYMYHSPTDFPVSSALQNRILSLPMYAELTDKQIQHVCELILKY